MIASSGGLFERYLDALTPMHMPFAKVGIERSSNHESRR